LSLSRTSLSFCQGSVLTGMFAEVFGLLCFVSVNKNSVTKFFFYLLLFLFSARDLPDLSCVFPSPFICVACVEFVRASVSELILADFSPLQ
jgi:hypothetical protein